MTSSEANTEQVRLASERMQMKITITVLGWSHLLVVSGGAITSTLIVSWRATVSTRVRITNVSIVVASIVVISISGAASVSSHFVVLLFGGTKVADF